MSGGHFDYVQYTIQNTVEDIKRDTDVKKLGIPLLHKRITQIGYWLSNVIHDLDWHISGDSFIDDTDKYEEEQLKKLENIIKGRECK